MVQGEGRGRNEPGPSVCSPAPQGSSTESAAFSGNRRADWSLPKGEKGRKGRARVGWLLSLFNPLPLPSSSSPPTEVGTFSPSPPGPPHYLSGPSPSLPLWLAA